MYKASNLVSSVAYLNSGALLSSVVYLCDLYTNRDAILSSSDDTKLLPNCTFMILFHPAIISSCRRYAIWI